MPPEGPWLRPDWVAHPRVQALMSTRHGGVSAAEQVASLNLRWPTAAGEDSAANVQENRRRFAAALGAPVRWLHQVHGASVLRLDAADPARVEASLPPADACISTEAGVACAVMVADCLPVLFADDEGRAVGAAHAGWRGLAAGVLQATVQALCQASGARPQQLQAWLGPCIGSAEFEVGDEVPAAFTEAGDAACFQAHRRRDGSAAWLADLPALARRRLAQAGVLRCTGGSWCTVQQSSDFFSHRASGGGAGRMAAGIVLRG